MQITDKFLQLATKADLTTTLKSAGQRTAKDLNCMRIGIIQKFYPQDLTVQVQVANKKDVGGDFAPIRAKLCYCNPYQTFPVEKGEECVLLFSDREIESWFINGGANAINHPRMHALTDAVAIVGLRSLPRMISLFTEGQSLFYGQSNIKICDETISLSSNLVTSENFQAQNGATGTLKDSQGKTLAKVEYGIITQIY